MSRLVVSEHDILETSLVIVNGGASCLAPGAFTQRLTKRVVLSKLPQMETTFLWCGGGSESFRSPEEWMLGPETLRAK